MVSMKRDINPGRRRMPEMKTIAKRNDLIEVVLNAGVMLVMVFAFMI